VSDPHPPGERPGALPVGDTGSGARGSAGDGGARPGRPPWVAAAVAGLLVALAAGLLLARGPLGDGGDEPPDNDPDALQASVASFDLAVGPPARFLVGLFSFDQRTVAHGSVALRFAYLGPRASAGTAEPVPGPEATARFLALPGSGARSSPTTTGPPSPGDPDGPRFVDGSGVRGVYAAEVGFDRAGFWQVEVTGVVGGQERSAMAAFEVLADHEVPMPGDAADPTENLTLDAPASVPRAAIDSRASSGSIPDPELHTDTIAGALAAGRPVVAVFSTPVYCQSRFCGPITDLVGELAATYGDRASFVHVEVWRDFEAKEVNAAAAAWITPDGNEPWVFVIGADGTIVARFDNVVTADDLLPLLETLPVAPDPGDPQPTPTP